MASEQSMIYLAVGYVFSQVKSFSIKYRFEKHERVGSGRNSQI
jgi:hypothetical protein